jgi:hypothetical protein
MKFLKSVLELPSFSEIMIVEDNNEILTEKSKPVLRSCNFKTLQDYEIAFEILVNQGYPWVNLSCAGVYDEKLILTISKPGDSTEKGGRLTSVNLSGPIKLISDDPGWNLEKGYEVI